MFRLPTINHHGGRRTYQDVPVTIKRMDEERHWRNLWLKKTKKIAFRLEKTLRFRDGNMEIQFPENIIIHDFSGELAEEKIGNVMTAKIGYADKNQQHYHGIYAFSVAIIRQGEPMHLVQ